MLKATPYFHDLLPISINFLKFSQSTRMKKKIQRLNFFLLSLMMIDLRNKQRQKEFFIHDDEN